MSKIHRFDAEPAPNFYYDVDSDLDPDRDWHQNDADPQADHTPNFYTFTNLDRPKPDPVTEQDNR